MDHHGCLAVTGQVTEGDIADLMDSMLAHWIPVQGAIWLGEKQDGGRQ